VAAQI